MKKILFIHHGKVMGGAPTSLKYLLNSIDKSIFKPKVIVQNEQMASFFKEQCGADVKVFQDSLSELGKIIIGWSPLLQISSFKIIKNSIRYIRGRINDYKELFNKEKPDLIHLNSATLIIPAIAAKKLNIPVIMHVREVFGGSKYNVKRILVGKWVQTLANHFITISDIEKEMMSASNNPKVTTVYNYVDIEKFTPNRTKSQIRDELKIPNTSSIFITVGGVAPRKGLHLILSAMQKLNSDFHLIVAGPELNKSSKLNLKIKWWLFFENLLIKFRFRSFPFVNYNERCLQIYNSLKHRDNIHFVGKIIDIQNYIAASDCLLFIGMSPHFPRPVYESFMLNKPVIVSKMKGISSHVNENVDGLILNRLNHNSLTKSLILSTKIKWNIKDNGRVKALQKFNASKNSEKINSIFKNWH